MSRRTNDVDPGPYPCGPLGTADAVGVPVPVAVGDRDRLMVDCVALAVREAVGLAVAEVDRVGEGRREAEALRVAVGVRLREGRRLGAGRLRGGGKQRSSLAKQKPESMRRWYFKFIY